MKSAKILGLLLFFIALGLLISMSLGSGKTLNPIAPSTDQTLRSPKTTAQIDLPPSETKSTSRPMEINTQGDDSSATNYSDEELAELKRSDYEAYLRLKNSLTKDSSSEPERRSQARKRLSKRLLDELHRSPAE